MAEQAYGDIVLHPVAGMCNKHEMHAPDTQRPFSEDKKSIPIRHVSNERERSNESL